MKTRIITGLIGATILFVGILWNIYSFAALMLLTIVLGLLEFNKLAPKAGALPQKWTSLLLGFLILVFAFKNECSYINNLLKIAEIAIISIVLISFLIEIFAKKNNPFANLAFTLFGALYIAIPCTLAVLIAKMEPVYSAFPILGFFMLIWSNDTGAYFAGKAMGKTKLFERISPNKTWEGTIGGAILSLIIAALIAHFSGILSMTHWLVISILVTVAGNFGDLLESLFKRSINVKDSGTILPGHGGVLDRFDSFFMVIPTIYIYLKVIQLF